MSHSDEIREFIDNACDDHAIGLGLIALSLCEVATQLKYLGNGDASTSMGAIEALSMQIKEGLESIAASIGSSE